MATARWRAEDPEVAAEAAEVTTGAEDNGGGAGEAVSGAGREAGGAPPPREAVARVGSERGADDFLGGIGECSTGMAGGSGINIRLPYHEVKGHAQGP